MVMLMVVTVPGLRDVRLPYPLAFAVHTVFIANRTNRKPAKLAHGFYQPPVGSWWSLGPMGLVDFRPAARVRAAYPKASTLLLRARDAWHRAFLSERSAGPDVWTPERHTRYRCDGLADWAGARGGLAEGTIPL